jgi:uncharacterized membrane protein (UPF0182 family)
VVPVGGSLIYLQPVYLQSQSSKFPAFQKIIVASPRNIVWGSTLQDALTQLLAREGAGGPGPSPGPTPTPTPTPTPSGEPGASATPTPTGSPGASLPPNPTVEQLIAYANEHFELAEQARRAGDFSRYLTEIEVARQAVAQAFAQTR